VDWESECIQTIVIWCYFILAGIDVDGDELGIAVVKAGHSEIGQWQYLADEIWHNIDLTTNMSKKGLIESDETELLFLKPAQKIRFKPSQLDKVWRKIDAFKTMLRFVSWDQTDGLASGLHKVAVKGWYLIKVLHM
jgi:hypothetical protein